MFKIIVAATAFSFVAPAAAQLPDPAPLMASEREAMRAFAWMDGQWRGEAVTSTPSGEHRVVHTERIGQLLGGTVRLIEGHSYRSDGTTGFNALAMLSFDPATQKYRMTSHAEGRFGDFEIVPDGTGYRWSIPAGPRTIRYTAALKQGVWTEIGEYIVKGQAPRRFFRMDLRRLGASDWPAAGAIPPR